MIEVGSVGTVFAINGRRIGNRIARLLFVTRTRAVVGATSPGWAVHKSAVASRVGSANSRLRASKDSRLDGIFSRVPDPDFGVDVAGPFKALHARHVQPCPELPWENQVNPKEDDDQALEQIVLDGPKGAIVLAGTSTAIVILIWIVFYVLVFLPRGVIQ